MKRLLCMLLTLLLVSPAGCGLAQVYEGYWPLATNRAGYIGFDGSTVKWSGKTYALDENTYFLDYRLEEEQISENPYAFNDLRDALSALNDGTADKPMTLLIAPGVYWLRNFGEAGGTDSLHCTARAIHVVCENLHLVGLSNYAQNIVIGLEHRETRSDYCEQGLFSMFVVDGQGMRCENLTIGSYETHSLEYALAPELSRERLLPGASLQQMLFSTGNDGVVINCCFDGRMSLFKFAKYYKDCRMLAGCRVETGACISCVFELNDNRLGLADLFGCEVLYDPIVKGVLYEQKRVIDYIDLPVVEEIPDYAYLGDYVFIDKYVAEMYMYPEEETLREYYYNSGTHLQLPIDFQQCRIYWWESDALRNLLPNSRAICSDGNMMSVNELQHAVYIGECAELGLKLDVVGGPYTDPEQQEQYEKKIAKLQEDIENTKNEKLKKKKQQNLEKVLSAKPASFVDLCVPMEVLSGFRWIGLSWDDIIDILQWEEKNSGRVVLLPMVDNDVEHESWYQCEGREPVYDADGNLQDAYLRDENGDVIRYHEGQTVQILRVNSYNCFMYLYGVAPEDICQGLWDYVYTGEYPSVYIVDTNFSLGETLKSLELDAYISWAGFIGNRPYYMNMSVDGVPYDLSELMSSLPPESVIISEELTNAVRVQTPYGIIYNLPNLYGEDPFNVTELIRQAAIANGEDADAYLNIPLDIPEE